LNQRDLSLWGCRTERIRVTKSFRSGTVLESSTTAGDSPVRDMERPLVRHLSNARHVKAGANPRGPSRKAKYSLATDSEKVARAKDGKNPYKGRILNLKPHAYKRSEPDWVLAPWGDGVPFA